MLFTALSYSQVGINIATPHTSSALDITSTTGGLLVPRMTEVQRDDINSSSNPAIGLMIYQTDGASGFYFWNGSAWTKIDGVAGPQGTDGNDGLQGETGVAGPPGQQGIQGLEGAQGEAGSQGIQGLQGDIGLTGATGPQGETGSNSGGFKTINEIFNERILVQYASSVNSSLSNINSDNIIVNFFTNVDAHNITNFRFSCYDINGNLLNLYVEELRYRRDTDYAMRRDFTRIETFYYNSTAPSRSYTAVTGQNGAGIPEAKGDFKVWSDGIIDTIDYLIENNNNNNTNSPSDRNPRLIIYNFD